MGFKNTGGYRLERKTLAGLTGAGMEAIAEHFQFEPEAEAATVTLIDESGEDIEGQDIEVIYAEQRGVIGSKTGFDVTLADSLRDTVERFLGLNSKRLETPAYTMILTGAH